MIVRAPKRKTFQASRGGRCPICTRLYQAGDDVIWTTRMHKTGKVFLPAHVECVQWEGRERSNPRTRDGGYDVPPARRTHKRTFRDSL